MEIIKDIGFQISAESMLYLTPEQPLFDLGYTQQLLEQNEISTENKPPFLVRQTVQGLSPVLITKEGFSQLKAVNWSPRLVFTSHAGGDGMNIMRGKIENEPYDLARGSFALRSKRDANHLGFVLNKLESEKLAWSAKNMIEASSTYVGNTPKEVDLECAGTPFPERTGLPQGIPQSEMPIKLFHKIYNEICSWEDGLLSLGDLSDILTHSESGALLKILKEKKPYGLHIVLNTEKLLLEENLQEWLEIPADIITLRVTTLSDSLFHSIIDCEDLIKKFSEYYLGKGKVLPCINLELHKREDNLEDIHTVVEIANRHGCSYNWIAHNDYCQQVKTSAVIQSTPNKRYACEKLLNQVYILSDGRVSSCKQDFSGKVSWGDLNNNTIQEVWNLEKYLDARKGQIEGEYKKTTSLCKNCHQWLHA
jgi:radical SAM protein with 4Fe4S-binding SPASM domain